MSVKAWTDRGGHAEGMADTPYRAEPGTLAGQLGRPGIAAVVDAFYDRIQAHRTLAAPFGRVEHWPDHKARLTHFWWVMLGGEPYLSVDFNVPLKHFEAGFTEALLVDWLALFGDVQRDLLPPELAEAWFGLATGMGRNLARMNASLVARQG